RAEAHRALVVALRLRLLDALATTGADGTRAERDAARAQLDETLAQAFRLASNARRVGPETVEANLAFASYQAVKGALPELGFDLAAARRHAGNAGEEVTRESAHLEALSGALAARGIASFAEAARVLEQLRAVTPGDARLEVALVVSRVLAGARGEALEANVDTWRSRLPEAWPEGIKQLFAPASSAPEATVVPAPSREPSAAPDEGYDELLRRAETARLREKTRTALTLYQQAVALRSDAVAARVGLGWSYLDLDNPAAALAEFKRAVQLDDQHADAHLGVAEASRARRDGRAALVSYRRYLELSPQGRDAAAARAAIKTLQRDMP
ncbi:MAG: tetratricopeptide repeat protein, partial [Myxococcota bacterium]